MGVFNSSPSNLCATTVAVVFLNFEPLFKPHGHNDHSIWRLAKHSLVRCLWLENEMAPGGKMYKRISVCSNTDIC